MSIDFAAARGTLVRFRSILLAGVAALALGACSAGGELGLASLDLNSPLSGAAPKEEAAPSKADLEKAIAFWGEKHKKEPQNVQAAINYSRNLKAAGRRDEAFSVLQAASLIHGDNKELASEYGRMALDLGQVNVAGRLLAMADDPAKPDWRVISARGTVLAKEGSYAEAIPFYERALTVSPQNPSVLNNLALAHAASGNPARAEEILRVALAKRNDPKLGQNLALVLGLQGKHEEARAIAASHTSAETATANTDYMRRMVRAEAAPAAGGPAPAAAPVAAPAPAASKAAPTAKAPAGAAPVAKGKATATAKAKAPAADAPAAAAAAPSAANPAAALADQPLRPAAPAEAVESFTGGWATSVMIGR